MRTVYETHFTLNHAEQLAAQLLKSCVPACSTSTGVGQRRQVKLAAESACAVRVSKAALLSRASPKEGNESFRGWSLPALKLKRRLLALSPSVGSCNGCNGRPQPPFPTCQLHESKAGLPLPGARAA